MDTITCQICGYQNSRQSYFCTKCGRFLLRENFENSENVEMAELKLSRIASNLKENPHTDILWNDTIDAYARKVERIESLLRLQDMGIESSDLNQKIDRFLQLCRKPDFEIAFVGAVKAGKSTLINALLGQNYASTDPNPETAVLTKFRSSEQDYVNIKFYSKKEWDALWKSVQSDAEKFLELYKELEADKYKDEWVGHNSLHIHLANHEIEAALKKWSSSQSAVHFFVKEIEVGISSLPKDFPKQIVFVDTPGLFDPVAFRSQISVDYIHKANAVLVCVKADSLHGEEVKTIESVFSFSGHKRSKVFIVATNWDKLNNVVTDWEKRYQYMVNEFVGKAFFPTKELAKSNILYASAYYYNLCREYRSLRRVGKNKVNVWLMNVQNSIDSCMEEGQQIPDYMNGLLDIPLGILSSADIEQLMRITNIQNISNIITNELIKQYAELLYGDIKTLYDEIMYKVKRVASERKKTIDERITLSYSDMKKVEQKIQEMKSNQEKIQRAQQQLETALNSLNKSTQKRLDIILKKMG